MGKTKAGLSKNWRNYLAEAFVIRGSRKRYLHEIRALEWASREEIANYQQAQLHRVLTDARKEIPFYKKHAKGENLCDFPVLTRDMIRENRQQLCLSSSITRTTLKETTSGTTNVPLSFLLDGQHRDRGSMQKVFFDEWAGLRLGDRLVKLWGIFPANTIKGRIRDGLSNWIRNVVSFNAVNLPASQIEEFAKRVERMNPKLILGYANTLSEVARYLDKEDIRLQVTGTVMTSTSSLTQEKRRVIESVFRRPIFDRYGSREMIDFACDCDRHEGLHVSPYMHVVEILDEKDQPCPPGKMGRVVVTQLFNPVMPLIRYDLGDYATWAEAPCTCGRHWPMIKSVDGRAISIFKHRDGGRFSSYYCLCQVNEIIGEKWIKRMQIIQEDYHRFTVRLVLEESFPWTEREDHRRHLQAKIEELIEEPARVDFDRVASIPNQASGKFLQAICRIPD